MTFIILIAMLFNIHIFQLSGYHYNEYFKYLWRRKILVIFRIILLIMYVLGYKYLLFFAVILTIYPRVIHKKLVFTKRVIRLVIASVLVSLLSLLGHGIVYLLLSDVIVLISNLFMYPIEKYINVSFIKKAKAKQYKGKVIAITGSYGKTSTKNYIYEVLQKKYNVLMTPKSYNTPLGISKIINEKLNDSYDFFIVEMGASKVGDIEELMNIIKPDFSVITSYGNQHLETFKTRENIILEKRKILNNNTGVSFVSYLTNETGIVYGSNIKNIVSNDNDMTFNYKELEIKSKLIGVHNALNLTCAIEIGRYFKINDKDILYVISNIKNVQNRLNRYYIGNTLVIDDSFNSNLEGAKNALKHLDCYNKKKYVITPGFVELGKDFKESHIEYAQSLELVADHILIVKNKFLNKCIKNSIYFSSFKKAFKYVVNAKEEKVLLIENDLPDNY